MKILIKNGKIITADETSVLDILIENGKIADINKNIPELDLDKIIDASGKYIIPGGIDPHVHLHLPTSAGFSTDDFYSGSKAALFGGTTTLLDFVTPHKAESLVDALAMRKTEAFHSLADFSFHVSPIDWHKNIENEILECKNLGITSFKVYLAYLKTIGLDLKTLLKVLKTVGKIGGMVTIHCEMGNEIEKLQNQFFLENKLEPKYHALSRPAYCESDAVKLAIELANEANCPIYIVHVSAKESLEHIKNAKQKGQKVYGETCPHYLLLDDTKYEEPFSKSAPYIMSPPLRKKEDQEALWNALKHGIISTIGTDHCPFNMNERENGLQDFRKIPNGAGGIEHRLELLFTYGVLENRITLNKWVELCATEPAKIFGLFPKKGEIAAGSDADLVIWNPKSEKEINIKNHHQNCDTNIYEGFKIKGMAETVIKNGLVTIENKMLIENPSLGKFLKR